MDCFILTFKVYYIDWKNYNINYFLSRCYLLSETVEENLIYSIKELVVKSVAYRKKYLYIVIKQCKENHTLCLLVYKIDISTGGNLAG